MERILKIRPADERAAEAARIKWNSIAKPLGSFGDLEDLVGKIAAMQGTAQVDISRRTAVVMCADHGVVAEGISQSGQDVTALSTVAIAEGRSNINAVASAYGVDVIAVDLGVSCDYESDAVIRRKIARGTGDIAYERAMTREQAEEAICIGMDIVRDLKAAGTKIIVTGEMGIGNTTIASAMAAVYLGLPAAEVTGRGAGLTTRMLMHKIEIVDQAIQMHQPDPRDAVDVLSKVGGFEVAGMAGLFLGGAVYGIPVIIDGVISAAAAYTAYLLNPLSIQYMLAGHLPAEHAGALLLEKLALRPLIDAHLRLGEGTGGILLLPLLDGALSLYRNSHTFDGLGMEAYETLV